MATRNHHAPTRAVRLVLGLGLGLAFAAGPARAFELRRSVLSGGALDSAGGSFRLRATVGEGGPVSGIVSGGSFLRGEGFWPGFGVITTVDVPPGVLESATFANALGQNTPNPFKGPTTIAFSVAEPSVVRLVVYDVSGRRVTTIAGGSFPSGPQRVDWRGVDDSGHDVAPGVYFYRLDIGPWSETRKMLKLR
jgi:hypothetical protein